MKKGNTNDNKELLVSKFSSVIIGLLAIFLGIFFEEQNVAFMVGLAFAVAASTNFPILFLTITWKSLTTNGAFYGGLIGLITTITLVVLGPTIWVEVLGFEKAIFPYKYPALFTVTVSFLSIILISLSDKNVNRIENLEKFNKLTKRAYLGKD